MRGAVRVAALSDVHVIYSWTHDSIGLGQDGPTHQPIEQLAAMRAMPGLRVIRPADANETAQAWRIAVDSDGPTALILSPPGDPGPGRDGRARPATAWPAAPTCCRDPEDGPPQLVLIGTGSEVHVCLAAADLLASAGVAARVVSFPSWELFAVQPDEYRREVLPRGVPRLAVEAASSFGWERYADATVCIDHFGASAPGDVAMEEFGFTPENVAAQATALLARGAAGDRRPSTSAPPAPPAGRRRHGKDPMTTLNDLYDQQGQSPWLDNLRRDWLQDGTMAGLVAKGIRGVTSNPTIFAKAISGQDTYDEEFGRLIKTKSVEDAYWDLVIDDVDAALAILRPVYDSSDGGDGFVSVEVAPSLAHDTEGTIAAARALHAAHRPAQRPGQDPGHPRVRPLHPPDDQRGPQHQRHPHLQHRPATPRSSRPTCPASSRWWPRDATDLSHVASVASFFISRVDTEVDRRIEAAAGSSPDGRAPAGPAGQGGGGPGPPGLPAVHPTVLRATGGRPWRPRGPGSSARCGRRPRPRTPPIPTWPTSTP